MQAKPSSITAGRTPVAILGVPFDDVNVDEILTLAGDMIATGRPHYVTTVGVDFLAEALSDVELRHILFDAHLVVAEDKTVVWASKMLGNPLPASVTVPSFIPQLLSAAEKKGWKVFLLGGDDAVADKVRARHPKLQLVGAYQPADKPLLEMNNTDISRRLRDAKPDILLVAFGSPKQEKWINMNYRESGVPFVLGAGVTFDFLTGEGREKNKNSGNFWKVVRAVWEQWWRLRTKTKTTSPAVASVQPDPYGNFLIQAPAELGAAAARASQVEWQRAVGKGNVIFDLSNTVFVDSTGIGALIRLRRQARDLGHQFYLVAPRPQVTAALKLMKLDEFFTIQASTAGVRILMESATGATPVTSDVMEKELQIRWAGEVTALNAVELGAYTDSELAQVSPGMNVVIDLSRVTFVDSTGIGLMVRFKKNLKRNDVTLKFSNVSASVRNVIRQTQLESFLMNGS